MNSEERNRRAVSIEQILVWAYHDQMVHQAQRGRSALTMKTAAPVAAQATIYTEGVRVDSSRDQGFEAADDAWRVHDLVMKLGMVEVDCGQDLAAARYHALPQYRGAEPPTGKPGNADRTGRPWPTDGKLDIDLRALVMIHGSKATRPMRYAAPECRLKPGEIVWFPNRRGGIYQKGWFGHVTAVGILPGTVVQAEAIYAAWHGALFALRNEIGRLRLIRYVLTDVMPPWPKGISPS